MTRIRTGLLLAATHLMFCGSAHAQGIDPWEDARFHFGVLAVSPNISVANFGVDTNVFADPENPQRDMTVTVTPGSSVILRIGRARLTGRGMVIYQYFDKFASERSFSTLGSGQIVIPLSRIELAGGMSTQNARQRDSAEITARIRRYERAENAGVNVRVSGVLKLGVEANRVEYTFPQAEQFLGTNLRDVLERHEDTAKLVLTRQVTPLTMLKFTGEEQRDVFAVSPARNATRKRATAGFDSQPGTMFVGSAMVGFEQYQPEATGTQPFKGIVAAANISSVMLNVMRLTGRVDRSVSYSYDVQQSYYVGTSLSGEIAQHLVGRWEALASGGRQRLDYQQTPDLGAANPARRDFATTYGAGLGYAFGISGRFRINADRTNRKSPDAGRNYSTWRFTNSLDYAF